MAGTVLEVRGGCWESLAAIALLDWAGEDFHLSYIQGPDTCRVPRLQRSGQSMCGFSTIARRAGLVASLYEGTPEQLASVDQWLDTVFGDVRPLVMALWHKDNGPALEELSIYLGTLDRHLAENQFLCGGSVTVADVALLFELLPAFKLFVGKVRIEKLPKLAAYVRAVSTLPHISPLVGVMTFADQPLSIVAQKLAEKKAAEKKPLAEKKKPAAEAEEEDEPREKKKEYVFPDTTFNFYDFKTLYVNAPNRQDALDFLWKNWDANAFSFWYVRYDKLPDECKRLFLTKNLLTGFLTRADACRKYSLGVQGVYGEEPDFEIRGVWLWRGTDILEPMKEHTQFEVYQFKKLDPLNEQDRSLIEEYWTKLDDEADLKVENRKIQVVTCFK